MASHSSKARHRARSRRETGAVVPWPLAPCDRVVTEYDYRSLSVYAALLTREAFGHDEIRLARAFMHERPSTSLAFARLAAQSHLRRAHWLLDRQFWPLIWCLFD